MVEKLIVRIVAAAKIIRQTPLIFERTQESIKSGVFSPRGAARDKTVILAIF